MKTFTTKSINTKQIEFKSVATKDAHCVNMKLKS